MAHHLLVVDDEPDLRLLITQAFRRQIRAGAWTFSFAANGHEALDQLAEHPDINVVLTDINMPGMDGLTLLGRLAESDASPKTVVVSAYGDMENIRTAMNRGAFDFVTKPINLSDLKTTIEKTLQSVETEREAQTARRQLETVRHELELTRQLDEIKSRFFTNLSHEFRTPLTLILGPLQDALAGLHGTAGHLPPDQVPVMYTHARRLKRLLDQLLDLSKLEAGQMTLHARSGDFVAFLRDLVQGFVPAAERAGLDLRFRAEVEALEVVFDLDKLEKVVSNLISNALKFTPEGGTVQVSIAQTEDEAVFSVRDTGIGIPPDDLKHVFDRFRRVETDQHQFKEGTGVGLALAKELVERHGGTIRVESEPDFGSTFTVSLPLGMAHFDPADLVDDTGAAAAVETLLATSLSADITKWDDDTDESESPPVPTSTILIVEDHPDVRAYLNRHLGRRYRVLEAADGREGLEIARADPPDLIISDVMMPGMDGFAFCRAVKADDQLGHIPVVLLTARGAEEDRIDGLETGADDYLTKPFNAHELLVRAENLIEIRKQLRQRFGGHLPVQASEIEVQSADAQFLEQVQTIIEARMDRRNFEISQVADEIGLSPRQLRRKVRALTGLSPAGFVRTLRLQRAAQLLEQEFGTVSQVAYEVGFQDSKYFSRLFRQVYGILPSQYEGGG